MTIDPPPIVTRRRHLEMRLPCAHSPRPAVIEMVRPDIPLHTLRSEETRMESRPDRLVCLIALLTVAACTVRRVEPRDRARDHDHGATESAAGSIVLQGSAAQAASLPAGSYDVKSRLDASPRHGEFVTIKTGPSDSVVAWVVYPQRSTNAPVVLVVHEIFGLSTWIRGVADQLAADGFIAIAPDLLTGKVEHIAGDTAAASAATAAIRTIKPEDYQRQLEAVANWGMNRPSAVKKYGIVGFCWGGSASFAHAIRSPTGLGASVVYYGSVLREQLPSLASVKVPVLGLYGGTDQRIGATVPFTDSTMKALGKVYEAHTFEGAAHGFLRAQKDTSGAVVAPNMRATEQAWPLTIGWFRKNLGT
jgi:carboxymethylenebutenolidase